MSCEQAALDRRASVGQMACPGQRRRVVLVGVYAGSDPWEGWLDRRWPSQVGEEDAQLPTLWTDLGETAMNVIVRLSSFILLCIGVQIVWEGVRTLMNSAR